MHMMFIPTCPNKSAYGFSVGVGEIGLVVDDEAVLLLGYWLKLVIDR